MSRDSGHRTGRKKRASSRRMTLRERVTWFHKTRLKVLAYVLGIVLAGLGLVSLTTLPAWPVVGVIVAAAAVVINKTASRLSDPTCLGCGLDLTEQPTAEHGVACPDCGTISFRPGVLAKSEPGPADAGRPEADASESKTV